jgi:uncharacterized membrane protein HdeD (DUF308 family)
MQSAARRHGLGYSNLTSKWGSFVALGVLLILAGALAMIDVVAVTLASVIFIGAMLLVGGAFQIVHAFMTRTWGSFALNLLCGVLYLVGGLLIMEEPVEGSVIITALAVAALIAGGVLRVAIALRHRDMKGWWLLLFGGLVSVAVGVLLYGSLPWSGLGCWAR